MKKKNSVVFKLSLKFSAILTAAVLVIIFLFFTFLRGMMRQQETRGLMRPIHMLTKSLEKNDLFATEKRVRELPFFISCLIYDAKTHQPLFINNNKIPELPLTGNKSKRIYRKKFYPDSDLNIVYIARKVDFYDGRSYVIQIVQNTENDGGRRIFSGLPFLILLSSIPILLISFLLSLFITRRTIRPVVKITDTVKTITSANLDTLLPESGTKDELDALAHTFNDLLRKLKTDFERERNFTSNVSHELKTPVAVISGQANLIRRWGKDDPAQLEKSITTILSESKSMNQMITNLMQLSKLDSGIIKPEYTEFSIQELFERIKVELTSLAPNAKIEYSIQKAKILSDELDSIKDDQNALILSDMELLHQLITIFISNSIKFSLAESRARILWQDTRATWHRYSKS